MGVSRKCPDMLGGRMKGVRPPKPPEYQLIQRGFGRSERGARELGARGRGGPLSCHRWQLLKGPARWKGEGNHSGCLRLLFSALWAAAGGAGAGERGTVTEDVLNTSRCDVLCPLTAPRPW